MHGATLSGNPEGWNGGGAELRHCVTHVHPYTTLLIPCSATNGSPLFGTPPPFQRSGQNQASRP
ncbi:MAG: hypothetical protein K0S16_942 [Moraxellaceae bacterium]|nr:hypothetical protein [Moraxellaceae bacterium]